MKTFLKKRIFLAFETFQAAVDLLVNLLVRIVPLTSSKVVVVVVVGAEHQGFYGRCASEAKFTCPVKN